MERSREFTLSRCLHNLEKTGSSRSAPRCDDALNSSFSLILRKVPTSHIHRRSPAVSDPKHNNVLTGVQNIGKQRGSNVSVLLLPFPPAEAVIAVKLQNNSNVSRESTKGFSPTMPRHRFFFWTSRKTGSAPERSLASAKTTLSVDPMWRKWRGSVRV